MRPILIIPIPKIREEELVEARRLNERDAKLGAVELDEKGTVIDDLEDRRDRWRRWCGLSKVVCMRSVDPSGIGERKMGAAASLDTCENLIEMLLRRRQLSLPDRARTVARVRVSRNVAGLEGVSTSHQWAPLGSLLARYEHGSAGRVSTVPYPNSHGEMVDKHPGNSARRSVGLSAAGPQRVRKESGSLLAERRRADEAIRFLLSGPARGFDRIPGGQQACTPEFADE